MTDITPNYFDLDKLLAYLLRVHDAAVKTIIRSSNPGYIIAFPHEKPSINKIIKDVFAHCAEGCCGSNNITLTRCDRIQGYVDTAQGTMFLNCEYDDNDDLLIELSASPKYP